MMACRCDRVCRVLHRLRARLESVGVEHSGAASRHLRLLDALDNTQGEIQKFLAAVVGTYLLRLCQEKEGWGRYIKGIPKV